MPGPLTKFSNLKSLLYPEELEDRLEKIWRKAARFSNPAMVRFVCLCVNLHVEAMG